MTNQKRITTTGHSEGIPVTSPLLLHVSQFKELLTEEPFLTPQIRVRVRVRVKVRVRVQVRVEIRVRVRVKVRVRVRIRVRVSEGKRSIFHRCSASSPKALLRTFAAPPPRPVPMSAHSLTRSTCD